MPPPPGIYRARRTHRPQRPDAQAGGRHEPMGGCGQQRPQRSRGNDVGPGAGRSDQAHRRRLPRRIAAAEGRQQCYGGKTGGDRRQHCPGHDRDQGCDGAAYRRIAGPVVAHRRTGCLFGRNGGRHPPDVCDRAAERRECPDRQSADGCGAFRSGEWRAGGAVCRRGRGHDPGAPPTKLPTSSA